MIMWGSTSILKVIPLEAICITFLQHQRPFVLCFLVLLFVSTCGAYDLDTLRVVAQNACGVYRQGGKKSIPNTVIVTTTNFAFLNHIRNFKCWLDHLHMKALVFSLDEEGYKAINHIHMAGDGVDRALYAYSWKAGEGKVEADNADFGSSQFHRVTLSKIEAALALMKLGYDVFVIDTDVALIRDPFPFLLWKNIDYVHSVNLICPQGLTWDFWKSKHEGNTGLYWVRSTKNTIALYEAVTKVASSKPMLDDQNLFWIVIRSKEFADQTGIDMVALPSCRDFNYSGVVRTTTKTRAIDAPRTRKRTL